MSKLFAFLLAAAPIVVQAQAMELPDLQKMREMPSDAEIRARIEEIRKTTAETTEGVSLPSNEQLGEAMEKAREENKRAVARVPTRASVGAEKLPPAERPVMLSNFPEASLRPDPQVDENLQRVLKQLIKREAPPGAQPEKGLDDLVVFVSLSMPPRVLEQLSHQAAELGAVLAIRGFKDGSMKKTAEESWNRNPGQATWHVNPPLFRQYKIDRVPAIVLADVASARNIEDGCSVETSYSTVYGEMSIEQGLSLLADRAQPAVAALAKQRLERLKESRRAATITN